MKIVNTLPLLLLIITMPVFSQWQQPELSHRLTPLTKSIDAIDFSLKNIDEKIIKLSDYKGKVVLLNFWATWCPPCIREMPSMQRLQKKMGENSFEVMAINQMETEDDVFTFTAALENELTFSILYDKKSKVAQAYKVQGLPTTYIIDKKGKIRYHAIGGREFDHLDIVKIIEKLKAE